MAQLLIGMQIITGIILVVLILMQNKGTGLGSTFGSNFSFYGTKRGAEKILFIGTIVMSVIFLGTSVLSVVFH